MTRPRSRPDPQTAYAIREANIAFQSKRRRVHVDPAALFLVFAGLTVLLVYALRA